MAKLIRPSWAVRCTQSGCKTLFEVAKLEPGKQQEVVCPNCGETIKPHRVCKKCGYYKKEEVIKNEKNAE